jgi:AraC-like DNA-binding protein
MDHPRVEGCSVAVWGESARRLEARLVAARSAQARLALLAELIRALVAAVPVAPPELGPCLAHLREHGRIRDLVTLTGRSPRHLQRLFLQHVGIAPSAFFAALRTTDILRSSLTMAAPAWSRLAASHGFSDQSHLIRTFHRIFGASPSRIHAECRSGTWCDGILVMGPASSEN